MKKGKKEGGVGGGGLKSSVATKNQANVLLVFVIQALMCDAP